MEKNKRSRLNTSNWLRNENTIHYLARIKPYNLLELCQIYGISYKTFKRWLLPFNDLIGVKSGNYYSVLQVETIFLKLGTPQKVVEKGESY